MVDDIESYRKGNDSLFESAKQGDKAMQLHETTAHNDKSALMAFRLPATFADRAIQIVLDSLTSEHSKRAYERHLRDLFFGIARAARRRSTKQSYNAMPHS